MSLILDALKKSEQERRRERGPDLRTIHQSAAATSRRQWRWGWGWLMLIAVNGAAIGGWWWYQHAGIELPPPAPVPATAPPVAAELPAAAPETPQQPEYTRIEPRTPAVQPRIESSAPVEEFADLPSDVRSSLPAMTFSFHVYSDDPRNRTIIINGQRVREGSEVSAGVLLETITEDGVILAMDHRRVHVNVLTGW